MRELPYKGYSIDSILYFAVEKRNNRKPPTLKEIFDDLLYVFDITEGDVLNSRRFRKFVKYRQLYCYVALELSSETTVTVGRFLGFDHSTVVHNRQIVNNFIETEDWRFAEMFNFYKEKSQIWRDK